MTAEEQFLVYTAGFFDADGSVGVYPRKYRDRIPNRHYWLRVSIGQMRRLSIFDGWVTRWGGSLSEGQSNGLWQWVVASAQALVFLEDILPFLRNKHQQAELAIEFQQRKSDNGRRRLSDEERAYQKDVCERLRAMKKR